MQRSPYQLLGVGDDATTDEIHSAYERLRARLQAKADVGDAEAANQLKFASAAYTILRNPDARRQYDERHDVRRIPEPIEVRTDEPVIRAERESGTRTMKGRVLDFSIQTNSGLISGDDGSRYSFIGAEWKETVPPTRGMAVDFDVQGSSAIGVYRALGSAAPGAKSRVTAGVLALLLGGLGIHKFYLGYNGPGLVYLLTNTIGWFVTIWLLALPNIALAVISIIEGILYLTKTDEEFERIYVTGRKPWF